MRFIPILLLFSSLIACSSPVKEDSPRIQKKKSTSSVYFPDDLDSVDVLFFKKPFEDSLRYQRFFTFKRSGDTALINSLRRSMAVGFQEVSAPKKCLSEGKIIVPYGGEVFKVIYFSRTGEGCAYLYVIDNGRFHYYSMDTRVINQLNGCEELATDPK